MVSLWQNAPSMIILFFLQTLAGLWYPYRQVAITNESFTAFYYYFSPTAYYYYFSPTAVP